VNQLPRDRVRIVIHFRTGAGKTAPAAILLKNAAKPAWMEATPCLIWSAHTWVALGHTVRLPGRVAAIERGQELEHEGIGCGLDAVPGRVSGVWSVGLPCGAALQGKLAMAFHESGRLARQASS